jgi:4-diphosphocytidyl-2-C-methyl-D-erythritol kinase
VVNPVKTPKDLSVLLVKPGFSSDTAKAYRFLDEARDTGERKSRSELSREELIQALEGECETWPFYNDFQDLFLDTYPYQNGEIKSNSDFYRNILAALKENGAAFSGLSGSGSCCFGVFRKKETAAKAEKALRHSGNFLNLTFFLAQNANPVLK